MSICNDPDYREISKIVHQLNSDLYAFLSAGKADKLSKLRQSTQHVSEIPTTPSTRLVVTIPENLELTEQERCLLSKGLSYIPTRAHSDEYTAKADCEKFFRRLRLKAHFSSDPSNATPPSQPSNQCEDPFKTLKPSPSNWTPPPGKFAALDYNISKCRREVKMLDFKQRVTKTNLSPQEKESLFSLRQRNDVVVKPADKGGAVVVWARDLYIQEAERQLSDSAFYQKLDRDLTMDHNNKVAEVVHEAISKRELPPSATNLIVDHPHTSKFYLLPKIHKPGNPGRPIVSA